MIIGSLFKVGSLRNQARISKPDLFGSFISSRRRVGTALDERLEKYSVACSPSVRNSSRAAILAFRKAVLRIKISSGLSSTLIIKFSIASLVEFYFAVSVSSTQQAAFAQLGPTPTRPSTNRILTFFCDGERTEPLRSHLASLICVALVRGFSAGFALVGMAGGAKVDYNKLFPGRYSRTAVVSG